MFKITVYVDCPGDSILGVKEDLSNYCERFGDIKSVDVEVDHYQTQLHKPGKSTARRR